MPTGHNLAACQRYAVNTAGIAVTVDGHHFIGDIFNAAPAGLTSPPVKDSRTVPIAFINQIDRGQPDIIKVIERIPHRNLVRRQQLGGGTGSQLDFLVGTQHIGKFIMIGEIQIAKGVDRQRRHCRITIHIVAEILDEISGELGNANVQLGRELLAHAGICVGGRGLRIAGIPLDNQHPAIEIGIICQKPGG